MRLRFTAALVISLPTSLVAQASTIHSRLSIGVRLAVGAAPAAPRVACDRSGFEAIAGRKQTGSIILYGGLGLAGIGVYELRSSSGSTTPFTLVGAGVAAALVGGYLKNSADEPSAIDQAIQSLKVGETRSADVVACLGRPTATTAKSAGEEVWTYTVTARSSAGGAGMYFVPVIGPMIASGTGHVEMRSAMLTFKNGVLSDVSKTASSL